MPRKKKEIELKEPVVERPPETIDEVKARFHIAFPDIYSYNRAIALFNSFFIRATLAEAYHWVITRRDSITKDGTT